jgi:hypothetical protein
MHHPAGLLWIRRPDRRHRIAEEKVPLASIAPTLLDMSSIPPPEYMTTPKLSGFSKLVCQSGFQSSLVPHRGDAS